MFGNSESDSFKECFLGCENLREISGDNVFGDCHAVKSFESAFNRCKSLASIPNTLFDGAVNAETFENCFGSCKKLEMNDPDGKSPFSSCSNATNYRGCLYYCYKLKRPPKNLFAGSPQANNFEQCFSNAGLDIHYLKNYGNFLFAAQYNNPKMNFKGCFSYLYKTLPDDPSTYAPGAVDADAIGSAGDFSSHPAFWYDYGIATPHPGTCAVSPLTEVDYTSCFEYAMMAGRYHYTDTLGVRGLDDGSGGTWIHSTHNSSVMYESLKGNVPELWKNENATGTRCFYGDVYIQSNGTLYSKFILNYADIPYDWADG